MCVSELSLGAGLALGLAAGAESFDYSHTRERVRAAWVDEFSASCLQAANLHEDMQVNQSLQGSLASEDTDRCTLASQYRLVVRDVSQAVRGMQGVEGRGQSQQDI